MKLKYFALILGTVCSFSLHASERILVFGFEGLGGYDQVAEKLLRSNQLKRDYKGKTISDPTVLTDWLAKIHVEHSQMLWSYHSSQDYGVSQALKRLKREMKKGKAKIVVLGFSHGGRAAIQFTEKVKKMKLKVDLGFTSDPIPKGIEMAFLFVDGKLFIRRPKNALKWINFYQKDDPIFKGHSVIGADENYRLIGASHGRTVYDSVVIDRLQRALLELQGSN